MCILLTRLKGATCSYFVNITELTTFTSHMFTKQVVSCKLTSEKCYNNLYSCYGGVGVREWLHAVLFWRMVRME